MTTAKTFFDKFSEQYEEQSRYKHIFYKWIINTIFWNIEREKCQILDLGTGNGELGIRLAIKFPKAEVTGLDVSSGMINQAQKKVKKIGIKNIRFIVSPMEKLKFKKIDYAVSSVAFHHIKDKELVLSKIYQILPKGGKVLIGDWFKSSKEYKEEVDKLRRKNPKRAREFDESWNQFLKDMTKEYGEKHPKEYPICPTRLKEIIGTVGFSKSRIVKCPLSNFAVVIGIK
jgi:ubiquinone/menaquinone biosynthesis C-methylase UbiE